MKPPLPPLWKAHAPNSPSCSPIEWYSSTSPEPCERGPTLVPMIARRREVALEDVRLEVVVEEVGGAAGQQPDGVVQRPLVHPPEPRAERGQREQLLGVVAEQVRRRRVEERLDRLADHLHVVRVLVVGVGVVLAVARDLLEVLAVVLAEPQVVAVLHRRERRRHQQRHEAVLGQLEVVDDVRPEQAQGVREGREPEARVELLGDRRAADERAPLEDQRLEPGLGQVGAVDQAVVAATDDDRVVGPVGGARPGGRRPSASRPSRVVALASGVVFGMSGRLSGWVVERQSRGPRRDVLVAVVHVDLQSDLDARAPRGPAGRGPGRCGAGASAST